MLYLVPLPETKLTRRGRVQGSGRISLDKRMEAELEQFGKTILSVKAEIQKVYGSDAHAPAVRFLNLHLHSRSCVTPRMRGFNTGRFTGNSLDAVDAEFNRLARKAPEVPIQGGDSLISYRRRFVDFIKKLIEKGETAVILADPREIAVIRAITQGEGFVDALLSRNHVERGKVYVVRNANHQTTASASHVPAGTDASPAGTGSASVDADKSEPTGTAGEPLASASGVASADVSHGYSD